MEGIISFGNKRNYEDFKKQIPEDVLPLFDSIREFCFKLGENVIEDVRMHRVVFCKSMTFRWFLDVEPEKDGVKIKIQKSRKDPIQVIQIKKELYKRITKMKLYTKGILLIHLQEFIRITENQNILEEFIVQGDKLTLTQL